MKKEPLEYHCFVSLSILDRCHLYPFKSARLRPTDKNVNEHGNIIRHFNSNILVMENGFKNKFPLPVPGLYER